MSISIPLEKNIKKKELYVDKHTQYFNNYKNFLLILHFNFAIGYNFSVNPEFSPKIIIEKYCITIRFIRNLNLNHCFNIQIL